MKSKRAAKKQPSSPRGFTFTISIVILAITLIAMALFSQEWRKSQRVSFTELMPSEAARIEERVLSDVGAMLGAGASVSKTSTEVSVDISSKMPFKKEGAPIAEMGDYAASLPSSLKNTGVEAVLSANGIIGSNTVVMKISDTGQLVYSNDGADDILTYYYPEGWRPIQISADIVCGKSASAVGSFSVTNPPVNEDDNSIVYLLHYSDSQTSQSRDARALANGSSVALTVSYPDGTKLVFSSDVPELPYNSSTRLSYTKSPGGALILPFDANASWNTVRDYSQFGHAVQAGIGDAAPVWGQNCKSGGCYSYLGINYLYAPGLRLTETSLNFPIGSEKAADGEFEEFEGEPDDGNQDVWSSWSIYKEDPDESVLFDATENSRSGFAVKAATIMDSGGSNYIYQNVSGLRENTLHTLTFYSSGGGRYRVYNGASYLHSDGTWGALYTFDAGSNDAYSQSVSEFKLPLGSTSLLLEFLAGESEGSAVYYDSVSLRESAGMNGGFEYYYRDTGWGPDDT